jgi:hypothetical protein
MAWLMMTMIADDLALAMLWRVEMLIIAMKRHPAVHDLQALCFGE